MVVAELCNAAWQLCRRGCLAAAQLTIFAKHAGWIFAERVELQSLAPSAAAVARALDHPVYDTFCLALQ